ERLTATVRQLEEFELSLPPDHDLRSIGSVAKGSVVQLQAALDDLQPTSPQVAFDSQSAAVAALEQLLARLKNHHLAAYLGLLTILAIVLWQGLAPKRLRMLPPPLIAVVLATAAAATLTMPVLYVEVPDRLWEEIHFPTTAVWSNTPWESIWQTAVLLAVVASAETLLCATAVDQLHTGPRTRYGRELMAQGFGNMLCGLCGALPMTGVIVRSSANVQAGGQTRLSAILHGLWLLVFVVGLSFLLRLIPTASLAAMLVYTGYKLVDPKSLKELHKYGWSEVSVYAATVATIIFTDLLTGVLVGVGLSAIKLLYLFSHLEVELDVRSDQRQATLRLRGVATFLRLPKLAATLERVPPTVQLHVNIEHLSYIDHACLDLLANWDRQHEATGGDVILDWPELRARFQPQNSNSMTAHEMPTELEERQLQQHALPKKSIRWEGEAPAEPCSRGKPSIWHGSAGASPSRFGIFGQGLRDSHQSGHRERGRLWGTDERAFGQPAGSG
ncbi:MAG TPA: solute carrier family 23 protein, partial [Nitrospiraceae bacterium]|nr:solute carrier family 23 protein [Nitrospiraceae bacterium]